MHAFDIALYAIAIIAVLLLRATPATAIEAPTTYGKVCRTCPTNPVVQTTAPAPAMAQAISQPVAVAVVKVEASTEAPSTEAPATDYSTLKTPQLRKLCSQRGITWRNAHGKKHLRNAEMIAALMALA